MKSVIYISEKVENKDRMFGSNTEYLPVRIVFPSGRESQALFTVNDIRVGIKRGEKNPEDFPTPPTLWQRIMKWFSRG